MSQFAWVTLATNDSYALGALVVANSLKNVKTSHNIAVLITPGVSESMKKKLEATFNVVVEVNVLDSKDEANLALLSRPELGITFTKLHCWRLTQFDKCVFLDADTFILQNCDELFDREELSAAPDVGWPDCFNSGVFVFKPSLDTFGKLIEFATKQGSFDGGDQGLLNSYFSDWSQKDISKHLPFIYNTCSTACYSYLPAFKQFGENVKILHFIGQVKPWLINFDSSSKTAYAPQGYGHLGDYLQQWWNIFCADVHPSLTTEMTTSVHRQYGDEIPWHQNSQYLPSFPIHSDPPRVDFIDPWDNYYQKANSQTDSDLKNQKDSTNHENTHQSYSQDHEQYHESFHFPTHNINTADPEDPLVHQYSHKQEMHIDSQPTITEPHISIPSSSNDDFESNSNFDRFYNQIVDTSAHSINITSFQTFNHDNPHTNTSESPFIGNKTHDNGEWNRDSCQSDDHKHDVDDVQKDEPSDTCEEGGLAGALAQLTLGAPRTAEQQAYEEGMRRQCWEAGNIDYLGKDSFDNIWKRITKTIETKSDTTSVPPPEKNRSPTPQPEEKLSVEEKKEVKIGSTFNESEEDVLKSTDIHEETITEITPEGVVVEKKIVTYPGEETTEIEEIEEVDGQTVSVKRSIVGGEKKEVASKPLTELKNEPVVIVPGYRTVEFDEKTNSTTVTEKTTTGHQQTITQINEDGTKKIQTKTFFDPVEIPGEEEEEEETYEETTTTEPGSKKTTVTTLTETQESVDTSKSAELEIAEVESKVEEEQITSKQDETATTVENIVEAVADQSVVEKDKKEKQESKTLTDLKNQPIVIVPGHQKVEFDENTNTTTVTEKTTTGHQQTITTITQDGRTIVQTKVFYDPVPSEEIEEVETYEETHTVQPTTKKITTVTSTGASDVIESVSSLDKNLTEVQTKTEVEQQVEEQSIQTVQKQEQSDVTTKTIDEKDLQLVLAGPTSLTQKKTTSEGKEIEVTTTVSDDGKTKTLRKTIRQPSEEIEIEEYEETQSYEPGEVKVVTTTKSIPLVEAIEEAAKDIVDNSQTIVEESKNVVDTAKNIETVAETEKQENTSQIAVSTKTASKTTTATIQQQTEVQAQVVSSKTESKQTATEAKQTATEAKQTTTESKQKESTTAAKQTTSAKKTKTEVKETTTAAKQTATAAKQTTTEAKQIKTDANVSTKTVTSKSNEEDAKSTTKTISGKLTALQKKDDNQIKSKTVTGATKKDSVTKSDSKTSKPATKTSKDVATVQKPKVTTKNGETTTEVVRVVPGGTEHIWTTVRADGTTKVESKTYFDTVELEGSEEEEEVEEYEEVIEEEIKPTKTVTTKKPGSIGAITTKGPITTTVSEATPPNTPPLKPLVIGGTSSDLKVNHEILDTPPLDKAEQLRKKKLQSAPASKDTSKVEKSAVEAPKPPLRKKEVKKPATAK